jgi:hypothetical protein
MVRVRHVTRKREVWNAHKIIRERRSPNWECNIAINLYKIGCEYIDWICVLGKEWVAVLVKTVMMFWRRIPSTPERLSNTGGDLSLQLFVYVQTSYILYGSRTLCRKVLGFGATLRSLTWWMMGGNLNSSERFEEERDPCWEAIYSTGQVGFVPNHCQIKVIWGLYVSYSCIEDSGLLRCDTVWFGM